MHTPPLLAIGNNPKNFSEILGCLFEKVQKHPKPLLHVFSTEMHKKTGIKKKYPVCVLQ